MRVVKTSIMVRYERTVSDISSKQQELKVTTLSAKYSFSSVESVRLLVKLRGVFLSPKKVRRGVCL